MSVGCLWVEMMRETPLITIKIGLFSTLKPASHLLTAVFSSILFRLPVFPRRYCLSDQTRTFFLSSNLAHMWPLNLPKTRLPMKCVHVHSGVRTRHVEEELVHLGVHCCIWLSGCEESKISRSVCLGEKTHLECSCPS